LPQQAVQRDRRKNDAAEERAEIEVQAACDTELVDVQRREEPQREWGSENQPGEQPPRPEDRLRQWSSVGVVQERDPDAGVPDPPDEEMEIAGRVRHPVMLRPAESRGIETDDLAVVAPT